MYQAIFKRKKIIITNRDYKQILRRFNPKNFKRFDSSNYVYYYENNIDCPLCIKYDTCDDCSFGVIKDCHIEPCLAFINSAFKGKNFKYYRQHCPPTIIYDSVKIYALSAVEADIKFHIVETIHNFFKEKFQKIE